MRKPPMLPALALSLVLAGCATPISVATDSSLKSFTTIQASPKDTCETQKQVAAHNSAYDTLKQGKEVVYTAPCDAPVATKSAPAKKAPA